MKALAAAALPGVFVEPYTGCLLNLYRDPDYAARYQSALTQG